MINDTANLWSQRRVINFTFRVRVSVSYSLWLLLRHTESLRG